MASTIVFNETCSSKDVGLAPKRMVTVGQTMDERITRARKEVERLCIAKAKLEALGVLDHDVDLYTEIVF